MAHEIFEKKMKVRFVPTIGSIAAPSVAEITAGTDVTAQIVKDGVKRGTTNNRVDTGDLSTNYDSEIPGSYGDQLQLTFLRNSGTDTPLTLLGTWNTAGFIVIGPYGLTPAAAEKVEVYPVRAGSPIFHDSASNERQTWTADLSVTAEPNKNATVAA